MIKLPHGNLRIVIRKLIKDLDIDKQAFATLLLTTPIERSDMYLHIAEGVRVAISFLSDGGIYGDDYRDEVKTKRALETLGFTKEQMEILCEVLCDELGLNYEIRRNL